MDARKNKTTEEMLAKLQEFTDKLYQKTMRKLWRLELNAIQPSGNVKARSVTFDILGNRTN